MTQVAFRRCVLIDEYYSYLISTKSEYTILLMVVFFFFYLKMNKCCNRNFMCFHEPAQEIYDDCNTKLLSTWIWSLHKWGC